MAANLAGMFAQLNQGIMQSPMAAGGSAQGLMDNMSQSVGQLGGIASGGKVDPYSFMNEGAKANQGQEDLATLDASTSKGMKQAAEIYRKMGDPVKAMEMAINARKMHQAEMDKLDEGTEEINQEFADSKARRSAAAYARSKGDDMGARALMAGEITPADYYKMNYENKLATEKAIATRAPEKGDIVKLNVGGQNVTVRSFADGSMRVVGKAPKDYTLTKQVGADGRLHNTFVNKNDPTDAVMLGQSELPTYSVKGSAADGWTVFDDAGQRVRKFNNLTEAEEYNAALSQAATAGAVRNTVGEALSMMGTYDDNGNLVNAESGGVESALFEYLPGTDERKLRGIVETVNANLSVAGLQALKAQDISLTPISNVEIRIMSQLRGKLDTWADPAELVRNLRLIDKHLMNLQKLALGENPVNTVDWESPEYEGIVETVRDPQTQQLSIKMPDGTWIEAN